MFAKFFILFALVGVVLSTKNLREEPAAVAVPIDHERASAIARNLIKRSHAQLKADADLVKKHTHAISVKGKQEMEAAGGKKTMSHENQGQKKKLISDGYYVTRHRPNADCSGVPSFITAQRISKFCENYGTGYGSSLAGCTHEDENGKVSQVFYSYNSDDCTGEPFYVSEYNSNEKCSYNMAYAYNPGLIAPSMSGVQCTANGMTALKDGGLISMVYDASDSTCQGQPNFFSLQKVGDCQLSPEYDNESDMVNENTRYSYISMTKCTDEGKMTIVGYSDPACTRPMFQGSVNIGHDFPDYNGCAQSSGFSNGDYTRTVCRQPGFFQ